MLHEISSINNVQTKIQDDVLKLKIKKFHMKRKHKVKKFLRSQLLQAIENKCQNTLIERSYTNGIQLSQITEHYHFKN